MSEIRKRRGESVIDSQLSPERQTELFELTEKNTLEVAREWLWANHKIELSLNSISRWAAKRRQQQMNRAFQEHLIEVAGATQNAEKLGRTLKDTESIDESNIALLRKAYQSALILRDVQSIEFFSEKYTAALNAIVKMRDQQLRTEALKFSRDKFWVAQSDIILKAARDPKTREIAASSATNAEKIKQLREIYFADVDALEKSGAVVLPE